MKSTWLIGSVRNMSLQEFTTSAGDASVAAGTYYLYHTTASLDLLQALEDALDNAGVTNPSVFLTKSGKVRITADAAFTLTWQTATDLRDWLGFTQGDLGSSTSHVADDYSPLFWSPGYRANLATIQGEDGYLVEDTIFTTSATGQTVVATNHFTATYQDLEWDAVYIDRVWVLNETGGTFKTLRDNVLIKAAHCLYFDGIEEDRSDTTNAVSYTTQHGPYVVRSPRQLRKWYKRRVKNADIHSKIRLEMQKVSEYA